MPLLGVDSILKAFSQSTGVVSLADIEKERGLR